MDIILISLVLTFLGLYSYCGATMGFNLNTFRTVTESLKLKDLTTSEIINLTFNLLIIFICWTVIVTVFTYG